MLGKLQGIQQSYWCLSTVPLWFSWLLKNKTNKSPSSDQIPAEFFKSRG
jgi:hypothetical protein